MPDARDQDFMRRALQLARNGLYTTHPNPRVGCVLVKDDTIVGEGWHRRTGEPHAEIHALHAAGDQARGATAYITLEPCCHHGRTPPCTNALLAAGIGRVVVAMEDPSASVAGNGLAQLRATGVTVETGMLEHEARDLNPGFILRMTEGRPWVRCKLAMSLDGRTALASGESQWITGIEARHDVHKLRATSSAIMTGVGTILADNPSLNVRLGEASVRQPLRVVLDSELKTPAQAKILALPGDVLIMTAVSDAERQARLQAAGADVIILPRTDIGLDLHAVLMELARRQINEVHLECGATLAGAMLQAGLLDELIIYMAPLLLGDSARGLFHLPDIQHMHERISLTIIDIRPIGQDWRITARP